MKKQKTNRTKIYPIFFACVNFKVLFKGKVRDVGQSYEVYKNTNDSQRHLVKNLERDFCKKSENIEIVGFKNEKQIGVSLLENQK